MNFLDAVLGALLAYGLLRGIWNGFFTEFASLISLLLGVYLAIKFSHVMRVIIEPHVSWNPRTIQIVAFALTFMVVVIGVSLLAKIFTSLASFAGLGIFNKILGGIFGLVKMALMISISLQMFAKINTGEAFASKATMERSVFYQPIMNMSTTIYPVLEEWFSALKPKEL